MGEFLLWVSGFIVAMAMFEFFAMMMTFDDYGANWFISFCITVVLFMIIVGVVLVNDEDKAFPSDQDNQLEAQWSDTDIAEVLEIEELEQKEVDEYFNDVEAPDYEVSSINELPDTQSTQVRTKRIVPTNRSYIESGRKDYSTTVIYDHETREACDEVECFNVSLVQHDDGSFWACKRNYGACYEYQ